MSPTDHRTVDSATDQMRERRTFPWTSGTAVAVAAVASILIGTGLLALPSAILTHSAAWCVTAILLLGVPAATLVRATWSTCGSSDQRQLASGTGLIALVTLVGGFDHSTVLDMPVSVACATSLVLFAWYLRRPVTDLRRVILSALGAGLVGLIAAGVAAELIEPLVFPHALLTSPYAAVIAIVPAAAGAVGAVSKRLGHV